MEYVHLVGAEEVQRASAQMAQAASTMQSVANQIEFSLNAFVQALQSHEQVMQDFINLMNREKEG